MSKKYSKKISIRSRLLQLRLAQFFSTIGQNQKTFQKISKCTPPFRKRVEKSG